MNKQTPDYLIIGHMTKDNLPHGAILGGTCSYAGLTAHNLGLRPAIVTSAGPDIPSMDMLAEIEIKTIFATACTTFENSYQNGQRLQKWLGTSNNLSLADVPVGWQTAPLVHLAPMAQEISPTLCQSFPQSLLCVTIQGWLRGRDSEQNVIYEPHPQLTAQLPQVDILVVSLADVAGDQAALAHLVTTVKLGVETLGPEGCRLYYEGKIIHVPVKAEIEVDPTGAGDIFAATFFTYYWRTHDPLKAAQFANTCASLSVRGVGLASIPKLAAVEARWQEIYG